MPLAIGHFQMQYQLLHSTCSPSCSSGSNIPLAILRSSGSKIASVQSTRQRADCKHLFLNVSRGAHGMCDESNCFLVSVRHQPVISQSSASHQPVISQPSVSHQSVIIRPSLSHHPAMSRSSLGHHLDIAPSPPSHRSVIAQSSVSHHPVIPQSSLIHH